MSAFHDNALMGASGSQGYQISRSVRLRSSASAYFNRTFGSPTSGNIFTWSGWVKRGAIGAVQPLFLPSYVGGEGAVFNASNQISIAVNGALLLVSTAVYRDPSAWYHIVLVSDMGNATASLRFRVYVNGSEVTAWSTDARASYTSFPYWNKNTVVHYMGYSNAYPAYADGYMTEVNFIDGQALTPSSFGETDAVTGVWKPKKYAGTYGTNGFYLNFSDNSNNTATTIGKDYSGNGNNWTPNNISVTSGSTYDSMIDVPTPYADGGNGRGNYSVLNPLDRNGTYGSVTDGNLTQSVSTANHAVVFNSMAMPSGKTYLEVTSGTTTSSTPLLIAFGLATQSASRTGYGNTNTWSIKCLDVRTLWNGASSSSNFGGAFTSGTTLQLAYDSATGYMWIGDGTNWYNSTGGTTGNPSAGTNPSFTISTTESLFFFMDCYAGSGTVTAYANFGQRPFAYTPPSGFKALNTQNLPDSTIPNGRKYFDATTYTGNGTNTTVTNSGGFTPDLVWHKGRSVAYSHSLVDSVRGNSNILFSNTTDAESNPGAQLDITTNGFISTYRAANLANNQNGATYVGWQWKAGGAGSSNTNGSITSTVSVNATAGFSVVTYTGDGSSSATVGHGLGVTPAMIICKSRSATTNWYVKHQNLASQNNLLLAGNDAQFNVVSGSSTGGLGNLTSSTTFSFLAGTANVNAVNANGATYVAYCFSAVRGYSAFGSYTGNGSTDGPFVYLGFMPRWIMVKRTDVSEGWEILDTSRNTFNAVNSLLEANQSSAEITNTSRDTDYTANGFKVRNASNAMNASGGTYIYAAFAENPFKLALAR